MKLSSERKKELQEQYKQMKTDMGIFAVINNSNGKYWLETTQNLKGKINSVTFQLKSGGHPNKELQKDWRELGADNFEIKNPGKSWSMMRMKPKPITQMN